MNEFPEILTQRLLLRDFRVSDAAALYDIFSDDAVTEFYDVDSYTQFEQAQKFVNSRIEMNKQFGKNNFRWAICLRLAPEIVIGSCGFHCVNPAYSSIEIGYELNQSYWGKNIAHEAVSAMLNYCLTNNFPFPINRVSALTNLDSVKSIKLLNRLGFVEEGILRQFGYWKNSFHDLRSFSLLCREWKFIAT